MLLMIFARGRSRPPIGELLNLFSVSLFLGSHRKITFSLLHFHLNFFIQQLHLENSLKKMLQYFKFMKKLVEIIEEVLK